VFCGGGHPGPQCVAISDVELLAEGGDTARGERLDGVIDLGLVTGADRDVGALGGELFGDGAADAFGAAGNQGLPAGQISSRDRWLAAPDLNVCLRERFTAPAGLPMRIAL
jgi:hypothetical protein